MREFEIELDYEFREGVELALQVKGRRAPILAGSRLGHPDTWTPDEGGELEDLEISVQGIRLPDFIEQDLIDDAEFIATVTRALDGTA